MRPRSQHAAHRCTQACRQALPHWQNTAQASPCASHLSITDPPPSLPNVLSKPHPRKSDGNVRAAAPPAVALPAWSRRRCPCGTVGRGPREHTMGSPTTAGSSTGSRGRGSRLPSTVRATCLCAWVGGWAECAAGKALLLNTLPPSTRRTPAKDAGTGVLTCARGRGRGYGLGAWHIPWREWWQRDRCDCTTHRATTDRATPFCC